MDDGRGGAPRHGVRAVHGQRTARAVRWLQAGALSALLVACGGGGDDSADRSGASADEARSRALALSQQQAALARWSAPINLSLVPVAGAALPNGKFLFWSAEERFSFGAFGGRTYSALFDPATNTASERLVSETGHNMFCPGKIGRAHV